MRGPGVIGVIQARMGSRRLPGKILAPLAGRPLLALLHARLAGARVDEWWLACTDRPEDDVAAGWGHRAGLRVYRGETHDVLSRFSAIVRQRRPEWIVRITADNPFTDAGVVNCLLDARDAEGKGAAMLSMGRESALPLGYAPQLARASELLRAEAAIPENQPYHRSHVLSWLAQTEPCIDVAAPADWPQRPGWRWTVDTPEDLAMARSAFALFGARAEQISYPEMCAVLDAHPEIAEMNAGVPQKPLSEG